MYVSLICNISRLGCEALIMKNLKRIIEYDEYEIVFVIDNNKFRPLSLLRRLEQLDFRNITLHETKRPPPRAFNMLERRNRIANNHNLIKENLGSSSFVFGFEDDTELPKEALSNLIEDFKRLHNPGFIQGVQVGRWGRKYIGAWEVDDINQPTQYTSLKPGNFIEPIDAGGFYCFLTPTSLYKEHEFKWNEPLGPDVEYSLNLRKQGYQNFIDWDIKTKHLTNNTTLEINSDIKSLRLSYNGRWNNTYL